MIEVVVKRRGQVVLSPSARLEKHFVRDASSNCWVWTGSIRGPKQPYGRLTIGSRSDGTRRSIGAHQYSYLTFVGEIPTGMCVSHRCDNPRCVNPDHLFLGTWKDNSDDRDQKGRNIPGPRLVGSDAPNAKLTADEVGQIRSLSLSSYQVARQFGISAGHVRALRRYEHFKPPPPGEGDGGGDE